METAQTAQTNTERERAERALAAARAKAKSEVMKKQQFVKRTAVEYVGKLMMELAREDLTAYTRGRLNSELEEAKSVIAMFQPRTTQARSGQPGQPARSGQPVAPRARPVGTGPTRQASVTESAVKVRGPTLESRNGKPHNFIVRLNVPGVKPVSTSFSFSRYGGESGARRAAEDEVRELKNTHSSATVQS